MRRDLIYGKHIGFNVFGYSYEPVLFGLANRQQVYLLDMIALKNNLKLDSILTELFTHERTTVIMLSVCVALSSSAMASRK